MTTKNIRPTSPDNDSQPTICPYCGRPMVAYDYPWYRCPGCGATHNIRTPHYSNHSPLGSIYWAQGCRHYSSNPASLRDDDAPP